MDLIKQYTDVLKKCVHKVETENNETHNDVSQNTNNYTHIVNW